MVPVPFLCFITILYRRRLVPNHYHFKLYTSLSKDGVFAEYFSVNNADANLVLLPEGVSMEDALMTTDMMSTGMYGAEMANIQLGDTVVVFGIGPVGLMAVAGARALGTQ